MKKRFIVYLLSVLSFQSLTCRAFFDDSDREFEAIRKEILRGFSFAYQPFEEPESLEQKRLSLEKQLAAVNKKIEQNKRLVQENRQVTEFKMPESKVITNKLGKQIYQVSMELPDFFKEEDIKVKVTQKDKELAQLMITAISKASESQKPTENEKQKITYMNMQSFSQMASSNEGSRELRVRKNNGEIEVVVTFDLPDSVDVQVLSKKVMSLKKDKVENKATLCIELPMKVVNTGNNANELEFIAFEK